MICQGCIIVMVTARVFHINLLLICLCNNAMCGQFSALPLTYVNSSMSLSCWVVNVNDTPNYSIKKIQTLLDFSSLDSTVCYTANEIVVQHNALIHIMFEAHKMNMKAFLIAENLVIDNKSYTVNTLNTLPDSLCTSEIGIKKVTNNITAFYGSGCWLSNFKFTPFTDNKGVYFHSSEQFLHHQKAIIFNVCSKHSGIKNT